MLYRFTQKTTEGYLNNIIIITNDIFLIFSYKNYSIIERDTSKFMYLRRSYEKIQVSPIK